MNPFEKYLGPEDRLHKAILDYIRFQYPKAVVAHVPNEGRRSPFERFKSSWLGVNSGVPDLLIFTPGKKYAGLAIEVKAGRNKPSPNQEKWMERLWVCGWMAVWVNDFDKAKAQIDLYFKGG